MFEAQRTANPGDSPRELPVKGELLTGPLLLEFSVRLSKHRLDRWVDWVPTPSALSEAGSGAEGNQIFLGSLGWNMCLELAHHILNHHELRSGILADNKSQGLEADDRATAWMKGRPRGECGARIRDATFCVRDGDGAAGNGDAGSYDLGDAV
jgi:hypothetical protein